MFIAMECKFLRWLVQGTKKALISASNTSSSRNKRFEKPRRQCALPSYLEVELEQKSLTAAARTRENLNYFWSFLFLHFLGVMNNDLWSWGIPLREYVLGFSCCISFDIWKTFMFAMIYRFLNYSNCVFSLVVKDWMKKDMTIRYIILEV